MEVVTALLHARGMDRVFKATPIGLHKSLRTLGQVKLIINVIMFFPSFLYKCLSIWKRVFPYMHAYICVVHAHRCL